MPAIAIQSRWPIQSQIPRRRERDLSPRSATQALVSLLAGPSDRRDLPAAEIDRPDGVVRLVGDVERLIHRVERQPLRVVEPGLRGRAIDEAGLTVADHRCHPPFEIRDQDAVVA